MHQTGGERSSRDRCFGLSGYVDGSSEHRVPIRKVTGWLHAPCAGEHRRAVTALAHALARAGAERLVRAHQRVCCPARHHAGAQGRRHDGRGQRPSPARCAHRHPCAVGDSPAGVPPHSAPDARAVAQEHPAARPQHLPILRQDSGRRRVDARPRHSALARRRVHLGEPGGLLPQLQSQEGKHAAARVQHASHSRAACLQSAHQPPHHAADGTLRHASGRSICITESRSLFAFR